MREEKSQLRSCPHNSSIIGVIGEGVVLPCHVVGEDIPETFSVQWVFHEPSQKVTVSRYDGKTKKEDQDERYDSRTEFFHSEFQAGNMSLHLKNLRSSDKGSYTCVVSFNDRHHRGSIELQVAAKGGGPSIFLKSHTKEGIGLTCHAAGWFPKPEVVWLDGQGRVRKELSTTKMTMMSTGLYSVVTSMNLERGSDMEVSCRVVNNLLNTMSESRVLISDIFFPSISKRLIVFLVILCLCLVLVSTIFSKLKRNHKKMVLSAKAKEEMEEEKKQLESILEREKTKNRAAKSRLKKRFGPLKTELDFWEAWSHAVPIRVNPEGQVLELQLPGVAGVESKTLDPAGPNPPCTAPVLLGEEGFGAGKHYWEVEVGEQQDWVLGVVREKGRQEGEGLLPGQDYWALHKSQGRVFSREGDGRAGEQLWSDPGIGVLLDLEEGQVSFYGTEKKTMIVRMSLGLGKEPAGWFYPFLSKGEGALAPLIHPVSIRVPLERL
ncbi:butyrophilin subfamily 2 member A1-like [Apus apus]|uniref:butyrophilin subfamily 2 member A1-like n=1 Tax=Apus apus TaxID=8895 RepID=UPI0021F8B06D|nr:butyrophilin subfamily 2 member A1-like [Apus apus]